MVKDPNIPMRKIGHLNFILGKPIHIEIYHARDRT